MRWKVSPTEKPIQRSTLRKQLGKEYFCLKRWWKWQKQKQGFAAQQSEELLPNVVFEHQSTILRKLKNVDMWLQHNKATNLKLAISALNGLIIEPKQTFSLWYLVGKPTAKRGFLPGMVLENGQVKTGIGGGLCQLGNLLFWMVLHSPLEITERWRHSYDVFPDVNRKVPFGCGATLSYNYIDFQFINPTDQAFQLSLWLTEELLKGELRSELPPLYSYEVYEAEHQIQGEIWGGHTRHNLIHRRKFDVKQGELLLDEPILQNHAVMMYNPFLPQ